MDSKEMEQIGNDLELLPSSNKKLCCRREAARYFVSVSS